MNVEQTLTDELRVVAHGTQAPRPPDVAALVQAAGHARTRSLIFRIGGTALVAASVVAAVLLGSQIGTPKASPPPAVPSPSYYAPGVPYWQDGHLYVAHEVQPGSWLEVHSSGNFTAALRTDQTAAILRDGVQVDELDGLVYVIRLSPDGSKAAWIISTGSDSGELVVRDLVRSRDLGRLPLVLKPKNDGEGLGFSLLVTDSGVAFYDINDVQWKWRPGRGASTRTDQQPNDTEAAGLADPADFGVDRPVRLSPDHLWGAWLTDRHGQLVPDTGDDSDPVQDAVTVQKPSDPSSRFTFPLPSGANGLFLLSWESPTTIMVQVPVGTGSSAGVLTCGIVERKCTKADMP